jgi:two-component system, NarL family, nitrate/nitrite response regulator NarL
MTNPVIDETNPPRVLIVEDHAVLTHALCLALRVDGIEPMVSSALDERTVLAEAELVEADVVLLDLHLGDGQLSISMIDGLVAAGRRVLVLTGAADESLHGAALDAGAEGVVLKGESLEHLSATILDLARGHTVMRPARRDELIEQARSRQQLADRFESLSPRERDVLHALCDGFSAEAIAARQFVSVGTVRSHIQAVLRKLGVSSQLAAVVLARKLGWKWT